jgi:hypothetical protein
MENYAILSLEFIVQHQMEQILNLEAIVLLIMRKLAIKMLDNSAIVQAN